MQSTGKVAYLAQAVIMAAMLALLPFPAGPKPSAAAAGGAVLTSQIGFSPADPKFAVLAVPVGTLVATSFDVIDALDPNHAIVFTGTAVGPVTSWIASNTLGDTYRLDFTNLQRPGEYRARAAGLVSSPFAIDSAVYDVRVARALDFFRIQNSGASLAWSALDGATGGHQPSHQDDARRSTRKDGGGGDPKLLQQPIPSGFPSHWDATGGWYDAGDYNKYMGNTPWAAYNLLLAYEDAPAYWNQDEDSNGRADILDEADVGIAWMQSMVWTDGSVFERVFNGYNAPFDACPECETDGVIGTSDDRPLDTDRYADITAKSSYSFAAAGRILGQPRYLNLAQQTWTWAYQNSTTVKSQTYGGGLYFGDIDIGLTLGAIELCRSGLTSVAGAGVNPCEYARQRVQAHLVAGDWLAPSSWDYQKTYALERYHELPGADASLKGQILSQLEGAYRDRISRQDNNTYRVNDEWLFATRRRAGFGQNDLAISSAWDALWIFERSTAPDRGGFLTYAVNEVQWVWGRNPMGESWLVSSAATEFTRNIHSRVTARHPLQGTVVPGATDRDANGIPDYTDDGSFYYSEPSINQQAVYLRALAGMDQAARPTSAPDFPPSVSIQSPAPGSVVSGSAQIVAAASDDNGISGVSWQVDAGPVAAMSLVAGQWKATWNASVAADGQHVVTVRAIDTKSQTAQDSVGVHVNNGSLQTLIVAQVSVTLMEKGGSTRGKVQGMAQIHVVDGASNPVSGATVSGHWQGSATDSFSGTTDSLGNFVDWSNAAERVGTVTFTAVIDAVVKDGWVYDSAGSQTSGSATKTY